MTTITLPTDHKIKECYRVLEKAGSNVVWEILQDNDTFYQWNHYPEGDVYDDETHSQYYYHAHNPETENRELDEHGHFHLFLRQKGIPKQIKPAVIPNAWEEDEPDDICHLIGISMNHDGKPKELFTVNRWVTGETWYDAADVIRMLDYFKIDHAWPSWPTNIWLSEMVQLYKAQIAHLILQRDQALEDWKAQHPGVNPFEDKGLEIMSSLPLTG